MLKSLYPTVHVQYSCICIVSIYSAFWFFAFFMTKLFWDARYWFSLYLPPDFLLSISPWCSREVNPSWDSFLLPYQLSGLRGYDVSHQQPAEGPPPLPDGPGAALVHPPPPLHVLWSHTVTLYCTFKTLYLYDNNIRPYLNRWRLIY